MCWYLNSVSEHRTHASHISQVCKFRVVCVFFYPATECGWYEWMKIMKLPIWCMWSALFMSSWFPLKKKNMDKSLLNGYPIPKRLHKNRNDLIKMLIVIAVAESMQRCHYQLVLFNLSVCVRCGECEFAEYTHIVCVQQLVLMRFVRFFVCWFEFGIEINTLFVSVHT